ncbi:MAG TPA: hypothetical protein VFH48_30115 [Chloroflexota bacterium]|nr:hypothetical protein [Chloroflexota bacterium]
MQDSNPDALLPPLSAEPSDSNGTGAATSADAATDAFTIVEGPAGATSATPAPPTESVATIQRDALIFVPGMVRTWDTAALRDIASDVAAAMNRLSRGLDFEVSPDSIQEPTNQSRERGPASVTITRAIEGSNEAPPVPVLDLYTVEYQSGLVESQERMPVVLRAVMVMVAIAFGLRRIGRLLNPLEHSKSWIERVQILYVIGILLLYALFLGVLFISIFQFTREALLAVQQGVSDVHNVPAPVTSTDPGATPAPVAAEIASEGLFGSAGRYASSVWTPFSSFVDSLFWRVVHLISLLGALVWLLLPPRSKLKDLVTNTATDYLSVDYYLRSGSGAERIHGDLLALIDSLRDDPRYPDRRIYLVSYSFGSILAINALFPAGNELLPGSPLTSIHTLVTIGCPFDLVRMVRPGYFKNRHGPGASLRGGWLNVYTPNDILGSSFRDISDIGSAHPRHSKAHQQATNGQVDSNAKAHQPATNSQIDGEAKAHQPATNGRASGGDHCSWCRVTGGGMPRPTSRMYLPGSAPQESSALSLLTLTGFRAHYRYWEPGHNRQDSCFSTIVDYLYRDDPVLRR